MRYTLLGFVAILTDEFIEMPLRVVEKVHVAPVEDREELFYRELDWNAIASVMRGNAVVDARHALDSAAVERAGLSYYPLAARAPYRRRVA